MNISDFDRLRPSKRRERWQLERFIETHVKFPTGKRDFSDKPDLIVTTVSGKLGVEHTSLYEGASRKQGSLRKRQESLRGQIVESARKEYEKRDGIPLYVEVTFDDQVPLKDSSCYAVASLLAQAVQNIVSTTDAAFIDTFASEYNRRFADSLPREVSQIKLVQVHHPNCVVWFANPAHVVPELEIAAVQAVIKHKEQKLVAYKQKCSEIWLLIASDGLYSSSRFTFPEHLRSQPFQTQFDRVFYSDSFEGAVLELKKAST